MAQLFRNNAFSTLASSLSSAATTLTLPPGQGDRFPPVTSPDFALVTLQDAANNIEIVMVTARLPGGDSMTIARAQEGTTARAWSLGDIVEQRITASALAPLSLFAGSATAAQLRAAMITPSRTGADASGTWDISVQGNAGTATALQTARTINGTSFNGSANITVEPFVDADATNAARNVVFADGITGAVRRLKGAAGITYNPSTNVLTVAGGIVANVQGNLTGNAATVTNGVYTTGDQTIAGVKTWSGQQVWGGAAIHNYSNVVSTFTGIFGLGGRNIRKVTASNSIEVVNQANSAVTLTLADNGDLTASGNITAFSDERLKKDWDTHYVHGGLMLNQLPYVLAGSYTRTDTGERQLGVSAQQLRRLMPEAVLEGEDGTLSVAYGNAALVACVALAAEVMALRERVQALEVA